MLFGGEEAVEEVVEQFTVEDLLGKPKAEEAEAEAKPSMARVDREARPPTQEGEVAVAKGIEEVRVGRHSLRASRAPRPWTR